MEELNLEQLIGDEPKGDHYHAHEQAAVIAQGLTDEHPRKDEIAERERQKQMLRVQENIDKIKHLQEEINRLKAESTRGPQVFDEQVGLSTVADNGGEGEVEHNA